MTIPDQVKKELEKAGAYLEGTYDTSLTIHPKAERKIMREQNFKLFRHEGLLCLVVRIHNGNFNGYVAVEESHPLYGKKYGEKIAVTGNEKFNGNYIGLLCAALDPDRNEKEISIDMALQVHGGITFSEPKMFYLDDDLFGKLWWFGFDTAHSGDVRPYRTSIDRAFDNKYPLGDPFGEEYRDFEYVLAETKNLAEQLKQMQP